MFSFAPRFNCFDSFRVLLALPVPGLPVLDPDVWLADAVVNGGGDHCYHRNTCA
jgi:hypothetical protein